MPFKISLFKQLPGFNVLRDALRTVKVEDENCNDTASLLRSVSGRVGCGLSSTPVKSTKGGSADGFTDDNVVEGFADGGVADRAFADGGSGFTEDGFADGSADRADDNCANGTEDGSVDGFTDGGSADGFGCNV